ncbi:hypothetical protein JHW43_006818 [Diplocarpon mali]|nr:hypothetical protein JHW43_006818 [Diplocarpon mali]
MQRRARARLPTPRPGRRSRQGAGAGAGAGLAVPCPSRLPLPWASAVASADASLSSPGARQALRSGDAEAGGAQIYRVQRPTKAPGEEEQILLALQKHTGSLLRRRSFGALFGLRTK